MDNFRVDVAAPPAGADRLSRSGLVLELPARGGDSGRVVEESDAFEQFDHCIEDAQVHGLERADCLVGTHDC
jgi:hypothetical protein